MIILQYKICLPQRSPEIISRPRLLAALHAIISRKLIAIVAPAGYGKTSLLIDLSNSLRAPVCWYTLDPSDADPWEFLSYLTHAVRRCFPDALTQTIELLEGQGQSELRTVVATMLRELTAIQAELFLCFDDWHLVDEMNEIGDIVGQIAMRCPGCHILLASRTHPSLPNQMLLAARRQFACIDEAQLRFEPSEISAVIAATNGRHPTEDQARQLAEQSDGWITGVLLALQVAYGDVAMILRDHRLISRSAQQFLAEQVFNQLAPDLQQFLCETGMLEELNAHYCDTLLGREDSWQILGRMLMLRLFVSEIAPGELRYHSLFREFLQQHLRMTNPQRFRELSLRVASDYAGKGAWSVAFNICVSGGDLTAACWMLNAGGEELYLHGRLETLERAFAALQMQALDAPLLCLKAKVELDRGHTVQAQMLVDQASLVASPQHLPLITLLQAVLDRVAGRYEEAGVRAEQVLSATEDPALRGAALRTLAISQQRLGLPLSAITTLQQAREIEQARGALAALAQVQHELVVCYHAVGDLPAAEQVGCQAEACWSLIGNIGRRALTRNSLALNQALNGRYPEAYLTLRAALQDARDAAIPQYEAAVLSSLGDIYADLALWEAADYAYQAALQSGGTAFIRSHIEVARVRLLIAQGCYREAELALERLPPTAPGRHRTALLLLHAQIMGVRREIGAGLDLARQALERATIDVALIDQVWAWIALAWLHCRALPPDDAAALDALSQAAQMLDRLGSDSVATVAVRSMSADLLRLRPRYTRLGVWLDQSEQLRLVGKTLDSYTTSLRSQADSLAVPLEIPSLPDGGGRLTILRACYLGGEQVWVNGNTLALGAGRPREVLAYLITHPQGASRAELYRAIWGEEEEPEGSSALTRVIYRLRAALPENAILTLNRDTYRLDRSILQIEVDVEEFETTIDAVASVQDRTDQMEAIAKALDLYQGPFLGDSDMPWCLDLRRRLERRYRQALRLAAERSLDIGHYQKAIDLFHRILALDVTNVAAHGGIMRGYVQLGEPALAITQYRALTQALNDELGIDLDPSSEPEQIYRSILAG